MPVDRWATRFCLYRPDGVTLLPADQVPLYRTLTEGGVRDAASSRLARGVVRLAQTTGPVVVAEGIETPEERAALEAVTPGR